MSLSQMHFLVHEPVLEAVYLQPAWALLYFHTYLWGLHWAM